MVINVNRYERLSWEITTTFMWSIVKVRESNEWPPKYIYFTTIQKNPWSRDLINSRKVDLLNFYLEINAEVA